MEELRIKHENQLKERAAKQKDSKQQQIGYSFAVLFVNNLKWPFNKYKQFPLSITTTIKNSQKYLNIYALFRLLFNCVLIDLNNIMELRGSVVNKCIRQELRYELVSLGIQVLSQFFLGDPHMVNNAVVHNLKGTLDIISVHIEYLKCGGQIYSQIWE